MELILASASPRRSELLREAGYAFHVDPVKVSEIFDENMNVREVASHLATVKGRAWVEARKSTPTQGKLLLAADTVVILGDQILGKPVNHVVAEEYLARLSGQTHCVMTGVSLLHLEEGRAWSGSAETQITFRKLTADEIAAYVATGEPMDKAGAYAIQGGARDFIVKREGSWSNVVGLPLELLEKALADNGWSVHRHAPRTNQ